MKEEKKEPAKAADKLTDGNQGEQGEQGPQGDQGPQGYQGNQGFQGDQGFQGNQGCQGDQGTQGNQGNQGFQGDQGDQGNQGKVGVPGGNWSYMILNGIQGDQGFQGNQGDQGNQGFQGDKGFQGDQGNRGFQGDKGDQGNQGFQGDKGDQGNQGFQGDKGDQGNQGFQGDKGDQGNQGFQGDKGDQGNQGFQGDKGDQGNQGFQGDKGDQGNQGFQGGKGDQGNQGFQGDKGDQGNQGFQGDKGDQGNQGFQGDKGDQGNQGFQGDKGDQGNQGFQGDKGDQGNQGFQGNKGDQGNQGFQGDKGDQGNQGNQGNKGDQGYQGDQGNQGYQGNSGSSGNIPAGLVMLSNSDVPPDGFVNTGLIVLPTTLTRAFSLKSDMPLARMWQASAVYGGQIYAFGGAPNTSAVDMNSVINQMYDTSAGGWKVMEPMSARRFAAAAVTFDDTIFVMGGFTGSTAVNANEAYSPRSNSWSPSQPAAVPMSAVGAAGARYNNMVILLGGNGSGNATLQIYTPQTNQWSTFNTQAPQFTGGGAVMVGSRLYVLGGNTRGFSSGATSSVYGYLEMSNLSWTSIPAPSSVGFYFSGAALLNDKIYLMGGVNYNGSSWSSVYVLDYKTNTWTNSTIELAVATAGLSSAAVGNAMYVIGGGTTLNGPALANTQTSEANLFYLLRKL